ncbi:NAD-dependent epimerase/dehydratase family protein [Dactylosporangium sp. CS-033363]|uniref:NAD-dependent epimerase/dehydratase family protein n=1 Tax=Dactylosporangium sp. CS-033363 TaxID=3239935 RepID=UPI003D8A31C2
MSRHVVFGTGQIGRLVAERLVRDGAEVVAVNRSGRGALPGAEVVGGDATDPEFTRRVGKGADAVYCCLNATSYARWPEQFPPLQRGVLAGAEAAGARLVVLENLYAYGPPGDRDLAESLPANPTSAKAATRAAMTEELLAAHAAGRVAVAIGRASDYFGPGTTVSALGANVFASALAGRTVQVMGNPDRPHSYSYTPDVAAGLVALGTHPEAAGAVWHLPIAETRTTRQIVEHVFTSAGARGRTVAAGPVALALLGLFSPDLREYRHTLYQFTGRWVVDDSRFRAAFGNLATPLDDALDATVAWFRARTQETS